MESIRLWTKKRPELGEDRLFLTLEDILGHHEAEVIAYADRSDSGRAGVRVFLPGIRTRRQSPIRPAAILPDSRPEFYDFDLFSQPGQVPQLEASRLSELTYTVFDTETTGLNPTAGDEIIAIGAVRVVNRRLLKDEVFDRLINPNRDLPPESTAVHGIVPEMLQGQPTIDHVLPLFHRFARGTILVAHNAAFDMRMLQLKETVTGIQFINPVLDTLLLSAVAHPAFSDHSLEAIAARLGIRIVGRHTALGDALVTGEIFLQLLPLLEKKGIRTLEDALKASEKTYYARLKY